MSSDLTSNPADSATASKEAPQPSTSSAHQVEENQDELMLLPSDIRQQVEQEQALADAQKKLRELEEDVLKLKEEKAGVEGERDNAR